MHPLMHAGHMLSRLVFAHTYMHSRHVRGKLVTQINQLAVTSGTSGAQSPADHGLVEPTLVPLEARSSIES